MPIFRKDNTKAIIELDKDIRTIEQKVKDCDKTVVNNFIFFFHYLTDSEDKENIGYRTASNYHKKMFELSDEFEKKCSCFKK